MPWLLPDFRSTYLWRTNWWWVYPFVRRSKQIPIIRSRNFIDTAFTWPISIFLKCVAQKSIQSSMNRNHGVALILRKDAMTSPPPRYNPTLLPRGNFPVADISPFPPILFFLILDLSFPFSYDMTHVSGCFFLHSSFRTHSSGFMRFSAVSTL